MTSSMSKVSPSGSELVECHSGHTYADRPTTLYWKDQSYAIIDILARWRLPEGRRFRVRVEEGRIFDLHYTELNDDWQICVP